MKKIIYSRTILCVMVFFLIISLCSCYVENDEVITDNLNTENISYDGEYDVVFDGSLVHIVVSGKDLSCEFVKRETIKLPRNVKNEALVDLNDTFAVDTFRYSAHCRIDEEKKAIFIDTTQKKRKRSFEGQNAENVKEFFVTFYQDCLAEGSDVDTAQAMLSLIRDGQEIDEADLGGINSYDRAVIEFDRSSEKESGAIQIKSVSVFYFNGEKSTYRLGIGSDGRIIEAICMDMAGMDVQRDIYTYDDEGTAHIRSEDMNGILLSETDCYPSGMIKCRTFFKTDGSKKEIDTYYECGLPESILKIGGNVQSESRYTTDGRTVLTKKTEDGHTVALTEYLESGGIHTIAIEGDIVIERINQNNSDISCIEYRRDLNGNLIMMIRIFTNGERKFSCLNDNGEWIERTWYEDFVYDQQGGTLLRILKYATAANIMTGERTDFNLYEKTEYLFDDTGRQYGSIVTGYTEAGYTECYVNEDTHFRSFTKCENGNVIPVRNEQYYPNGILQHDENYDSSGNIGSEFFHDENGWVTESLIYDNKEIERDLYDYFDNGVVRLHRHYIGDTLLGEEEKDVLGRIVLSWWLDREENHRYYTRFEYFGDSDQIKTESHCDQKGLPEKIMEYDTDNKLTRILSYENGKLTGINEREYNSDGKIRFSKYFDVNNNLTVYEYDSSGRKICDASYASDGKLIQKSIIEYFEGSDVMRSKKIYGIGEKGEFLVLEYEMDDQDRIISITHYNEDGTVI